MNTFIDGRIADCPIFQKREIKYHSRQEWKIISPHLKVDDECHGTF